MKKIHFILFIVIAFRVSAQDTAFVTETDTFYTTEAVMVDSAYGSLDTGRISTKYLPDRVPVNFGMDRFNGLPGSTVDTIKNAFAFYSVYSSVYLSQVSGSPHFTDPLAFAHHVDSIQIKRVFIHIG